MSPSRWPFFLRIPHFCLFTVIQISSSDIGLHLTFTSATVIPCVLRALFNFYLALAWILCPTPSARFQSIYFLEEPCQWWKFPLNGLWSQSRVSPVVGLLPLASGPACLGMAFPPFLVKQVCRCDSVVISSFVRRGYIPREGEDDCRVG